MNELKELLMCLLIVAYGVGCYIVGRTNLIEHFVIKILNDLIRWYGESEDTE